MRIFDIIKTSQTLQSGRNIITFTKDLLSRPESDLKNMGLDDKKIKRLKDISNKSLRTVNALDLSLFLGLPPAARPGDMQLLIEHASKFGKGEVQDEFISAVSQPVSETTAVEPSSTITPANMSPSVQKTKKPGKKKAAPKSKKFDKFEFLNKNDDKNWKNLIIAPKIATDNMDLLRIFTEVGIVSTVRDRLTKPTNVVEVITSEQYGHLLQELVENGWDIDTVDNADSHLLNIKESTDIRNFAEVEAKSIFEETNKNWMYRISIPNIVNVPYPRQLDIVECLTFAFTGVTDDPNYSRELFDEGGRSIPRKRLCRIHKTTDIQATAKGWYVRGDPSDFQRFITICGTRGIKVDKLVALVFKDFNSGLFYDPRKKSYVDPKTARFEGIIDGDGYKSEGDFEQAVKAVANSGLQKKALSRNPQANIDNVQIYPKQIEGIKFLYSRTHAILGDETGVGKTLQAIVAGHLRLKTDAKKLNKDMKAVVLTKSAVVPQFKKEIEYYTGVSPEQIWTGDELFEYLKQFDHPTKIFDENQNAKIPVPNWKWCVLNYEKFAIPPRPQILRSLIARRKNISSAYQMIMNRSLSYAAQIVQDMFASISNAINANNMGLDKNKAIKNAVQAYLSTNVKVSSQHPSLYLNSRDSSWFKEKEIDKDAESLAKSTAVEVVKVAFENPKNLTNVADAMQKVRSLIRDAVDSKVNFYESFIARQEERLQKTSTLDEIMYKLQDPNISVEEKSNLEAKKLELEGTKGGRSGALQYGEEGKRNILTAYFNALSKLGVLDVVILDEVHTVKNGDPDDKAETLDDEHEANFTTFNTQIVTNGASNVWGASATIVANKEQDLYNQLRAINSPLGDLDYGSFVTQLASAVSSGGSASTGTAIRDAIVQSKIYMQRSKHDIVEDMRASDPSRPALPKQIVKDSVSNDPNVLSSFMEIRNAEFESAMMRGTLEHPLVAYGIIRRSLARAKAPLSARQAIEKLMSGKRVGIFTDNIEAGQAMKQMIENALKQFPENSPFKNKYVYFLHGEENPSHRMMHVDEFMKNYDQSQYAAIIISFSAGGTGLSLENTADFVIFNDLPQTPVSDTQAKGRFYRINSLTDNYVNYMLLDTEEDERLYDILQQKLAIAEEISKLRDIENQYVLDGHSRSELRIKILNDIREREIRLKALDAEQSKTEIEFGKKLIGGLSPRRKRASYNRWYNFVKNI